MQSRIRIGFFESRSPQLSQSSSARPAKYSVSAALYALRHSGQPIELSFNLTFESPNASKMRLASRITSASAAGSDAPNSSTPNWWNSRSRPACGFS